VGVNASAPIAVQTASDLLPCGPISTVEDFWAYYSHILKPSDLPANFDVCFFKDGCRPLCDDPANTGGGRWTARLKKGQTARVWEDLLLAMVAGAWNVHLLLQGAVISVRAEDDVLAIWSEHADRGATLQLRQVLLKILNPPKNVIFEYKRHGTYKPPQPAGLKYSIGEMQQMKTACKDVRDPAKTARSCPGVPALPRPIDASRPDQTESTSATCFCTGALSRTQPLAQYPPVAAS
jgi:hypothetical protein